MKIIIDSNETPAADVANILSAADKSFAQFARARVGGAKPVLTVEAFEHGSLEIVLGVLDAAANAVAILQPFAAHIGQAAELLRVGSRREVKSADAKFVRSIVEPVAKGRAMQVNIVHNGNVYLKVNSATARQILEEPAVTEFRRPSPSLREALISPAQEESLLGQGLEGMAFDVHGQWYARLLHGQGVLLPLTGDRSALVDGRSYRFQGYPSRGRLGEVVGLMLTRAMPLGN